MHAAGRRCPDRPATPYGPWSLVPKVRNSERPEIHRLFGDLTRTNDFILYVGLARALDVERAFHPCDISTKRQMTEETIPMKAIVVTDQAVGTAGMKLAERPAPPAAINDVIVQIHASGFVPTELAWPSTWTDRRDRDRTPSIPGHELEWSPLSATARRDCR